MKALALISGGLDSCLAAKIIKDLGIELIAFNTVSPFCLCTHRSASGCIHGAHSAAQNLGLKLISVNVADELFKIIKEPKHGYGSNMNPCIDCRILLFKKAKEAMQEEGASFIITGEVLGQRPMSQRKNTMQLIEKESGLEGLVLRPLSAKALPPSIPEKEGWINNDALLSIVGRGRREQMDLAQNLGINDYPCPSGGCLLTDPEFSKRLKDLLKFTELSIIEVKLLKLGRHFRLNDTAKLIVGRNEAENNLLLNLARKGEYIFMPETIAGPTALGRGSFNEELFKLSSAIICRYCDLEEKNSADITCKEFGKEQVRIFNALPLAEDSILNLRL